MVAILLAQSRHALQDDTMKKRLGAATVATMSVAYWFTPLTAMVGFLLLCGLPAVYTVYRHQPR